jgi:hypothetical protein
MRLVLIPRWAHISSRLKRRFLTLCLANILLQTLYGKYETVQVNSIYVIKINVIRGGEFHSPFFSERHNKKVTYVIAGHTQAYELLVPVQI